MNFRIDYEPKKREAKRGKISIQGKRVCITGSLPGMNRTEAAHWAAYIKGADYCLLISSSTDYLIVGKGPIIPSSKLIKATKLGIKTIQFEDIA